MRQGLRVRVGEVPAEVVLRGLDAGLGVVVVAGLQARQEGLRLLEEAQVLVVLVGSDDAGVHLLELLLVLRHLRRAVFGGLVLPLAHC
jgi:hypothetical protein